jgi:hypothetical protein
MAALSRRTFLAGAGSASAFLLARPRGGLLARAEAELVDEAVRVPQAAPTPTLLPTSERAASRASRLFDDGMFLVHADLHNHSHLSDGRGAPEKAFTSMRDAGLDVAALTDHSVMSWGSGHDDVCEELGEISVHGEVPGGCRRLAGLDESGWQHTAELADAADEPGRFVAIRGFEWSSPELGHANVWFSQRWVDPAQTGGMRTTGLARQARRRESRSLLELAESLPRRDRYDVSMRGFYDWLAADPDAEGVGGGADGLACFNHPGRERGRFDGFAYDERAAERFVSLEILNRDEDHLFKRYVDGYRSPLVMCLNAGWRTGLLGVTDEHGGDWGSLHGLGRSGLWVRELTREGVRDAIANRRVFATFTRGLRLDVAARPRPAGGASSFFHDNRWRRMGSTIGHERGPVEFVLDIDRGDEWVGRELEVQVLRPDARQPKVPHVETVRIPEPGRRLPRFTVDLDVEDGNWVVLRIADPGGVNAHPGPDGHPANRDAIAYASPFWLT